MAAPAQNGNGYARLGFVGSLVMAGAVIFGGIYWVGTIAGQVQENTRAYAEIRTQMIEVTQDRAQSIAFRARNCQELAKIETQFGTVEEVINDIHVHDVRDLDSIKFKLSAEPPSGIYHDIKIPHEIEPCQ